MSPATPPAAPATVRSIIAFEPASRCAGGPFLCRGRHPGEAGLDADAAAWGLALKEAYRFLWPATYRPPDPRMSENASQLPLSDSSNSS